MTHPEDTYRDNQLDDYLEKGIRQNVITDNDYDPWGNSLFGDAERIDDLDPEPPRSEAYYECLNKQRREGVQKALSEISAKRKLDKQIAKMCEVQA